MPFTKQCSYRYKGTILKSYFECCVAELFERCRQDWQYEPYVHDRNQVTAYKPDFWVNRLLLWVEPRGYVREKSEQPLRAFRDSIYHGMTIYGNEIYNISQHSVQRYDPTAPTWQYHDYLVIRGAQGQLTRFSFFQCWRKSGDEDLASQADVRDLVRRECLRCKRWFISRYSRVGECSACGNHDPKFLGETEYIVGLPDRRIGLRAKGSSKLVILEPDVEAIPNS